MAEMPVGKPFYGNSGLLRDSIWLSWEDLPEGRDVEVEIEKVMEYENVEFEQGRVKPILGGVHFVGRKRILGLNSTNRKTLAKMFGSSAKGWIGKKIALFVTTTKLKGRTSIAFASGIVAPAR